MQGYARWGNKVHPGKWQRFGCGPTPSPEDPAGDVEMLLNAKVLGCFLESDGGYTRELNNRIAKASAIFAKLVKQTDLVALSAKTTWRLFRASVMASLMYGTEARGVPAWAVKRTEVFVGKCEHRLFFGARGSTRDMTGKFTQADIRAKLGNKSAQLEIDTRTLHYLGHLIRLPADRWERRL
jgi:hypothetical protein